MVRDAPDNARTYDLLQAAQIQRADVPTSPPRTPRSPPRTPTKPSTHGARNDRIVASGGSISTCHERQPRTEQESEEDSNDEDDEEEEDDEEPLLKYTSLTKNQGTLYRNGDSVSAFLVAGDKLIAGTHNGSVNVFTLPSFQLLWSYKAHKASVTAISISPS